LNEVLHDYSEKLDDKNPNNVKIVKIDVDSAPQIAERYQVQGIPNVGIFKDVNEYRPSLVFNPWPLTNQQSVRLS
jgi:hypothetical protein